MTAAETTTVLAPYVLAWRATFTEADYLAYAQMLADTPTEAVRRALAALQAEGGRWFPTVAEILATAQQTAPRVIPGTTIARKPLDAPVVLQLPAGSLTVQDEQPYACEECSDTGWASFWCGPRGGGKPWHQHGICGRHREHPAHEWTGECGCRGWNSEYQQKRAYQVQQAASRTARSARGGE